MKVYFYSIIYTGSRRQEKVWLEASGEGEMLQYLIPIDLLPVVITSVIGDSTFLQTLTNE